MRLLGHIDVEKLLEAARIIITSNMIKRNGEIH
jgi:hypothetical protein